MAAKTLKQLDSTLTEITGLATGDTVKNSTTGLVTICVGAEVTVGDAIVIKPKDGTEQTILPGKSSNAITIAAKEKAYVLNTDGGMSSTVDKVVVG